MPEQELWKVLAGFVLETGSLHKQMPCQFERIIEILKVGVEQEQQRYSLFHPKQLLFQQLPVNL